MTDTLYIVTEPTNGTYADLLAFALARCATFSLVWRDQLIFEPAAERLVSELEPFLVRSERTDRWPGTVLHGSLATVRHYRVTPQAVSVLERPSGLYSWRAPDLPEDIAFYASSGAVWLTSISHEGDAWFDGRQVGAGEIRQHVPGLNLASGIQ